VRAFQSDIPTLVSRVRSRGPPVGLTLSCLFGEVLELGWRFAGGPRLVAGEVLSDLGALSITPGATKEYRYDTSP
jgi:hypothetical protein